VYVVLPVSKSYQYAGAHRTTTNAVPATGTGLPEPSCTNGPLLYATLQLGLPPLLAMKPKITLSVQVALATRTVVSNDDPCDFGALTGLVEPAGCGQAVADVVVVTTTALVVDVPDTLDVGDSAVVVVVGLATEVEVAVDTSFPPLLHAANISTAKQDHAGRRFTPAS